MYDWRAWRFDADSLSSHLIRTNIGRRRERQTRAPTMFSAKYIYRHTVPSLEQEEGERGDDDIWGRVGKSGCSSFMLVFLL